VKGSQRFFRYLWRINALLILVVASAAVIVVGSLVTSRFTANVRRREAAEVAPAIRGVGSDRELTLSDLTLVEGTSVFRATLSAERGRGAEVSSGYDADTKNLLFLDISSSTAKWLLPTNEELIVRVEDVVARGLNAERGPDIRRSPPDGRSLPLATVVLVKPYTNNPAAVTGRLLLLDVAAKRIQEVASGVRELSGTSLTTSGDIVVLFEKDRTYYFALFNPTSLEKLSARRITIPELRRAAALLR